MEEKQTQNAALTGCLDETQTTGKPKRFTEKLGIVDEWSGSKIKDISDKAGLVIDVMSIVFGIVIWSRDDGMTGFLLGILFMLVGIFASYVLVSVLYSYGDMVTNSLEQTKMLKRMEAQKTEELRKQNQADMLKQQTLDTAVNEQRETLSFSQTVPAFNNVNSEKAHTNSMIMTDADTSKGDNSPVRGVLDYKTRGLAHFPERTRHGIICPICSRLQDSSRNKCYSCECRFIYDNEPVRSGVSSTAVLPRR